MILGLHGVVCHGADAKDVQKCVALENTTTNVDKTDKNRGTKPDTKIFGS